MSERCGLQAEAARLTAQLAELRAEVKQLQEDNAAMVKQLAESRRLAAKLEHLGISNLE